jgi:hypothetical protein
MKSNYIRTIEKPRVAKNAMANYLTRVAVDGRVEQLIKKHEGNRMDELSAFAAAVDANWLWTLHNMKGTRFGKKRLRRAWEEMVRTRITFREFYRDGHSKYEEQLTGQNVEDAATIKALLDLGVDIKAWEREEIQYDKDKREVTFSGSSF